MYDPIAQRVEPLISRKFPKEPMQVVKATVENDEKDNEYIGQLNPLRKRIDYVLRSEFWESAVSMFSSLAQHSNYWNNNEVAQFIANEMVEIRKQVGK